MRYLSVCSGIEAASVAWGPLGWHAVAFSEIEPFPSAVLAHRFPETPNLGDMTKFKEWYFDGSIDALVGGTPCQSFSMAGLRRGLNDPRGNLMLTFGAIADHFKPRWIVWENVPGVLSSNRGRDFGTFLGMLAELGYGTAYRILDAQYFGVPQRRRRVFVVGHLGDWRRAATVLFESESLSGNPAPRGAKREDVAATLTRGAESSGKGGYAGRRREDDENLIVMAHGQAGAEISTNGSPSLTCNHEAPIIAHTLRGSGFDASEDGTGRGTPLVPVAIRTANTGANGHGIAEDVAHTLDRAQGQAVAFALRGREGGAMPEIEGDKAGALRAAPGGSSRSYVATTAIRRLTPRECERLQGFPDDWTRIPWRGRPAEDCPDGPRYKACGNSMAVPVMRWIGERIARVDA